MPGGVSGGVSVIIPTYEAWPALHRTVAAVVHDCRALGLPWELILVDNDSGPDFHRQVRALTARGSPDGRVRLIRRTGLGGRHFQPGAARNAGIEAARHDRLVFLDSDCVPSTALLAAFCERIARNPRTVHIGHRVFVDLAALPPQDVAEHRELLDRARPVRSASNYGALQDRRIAELRALDAHPRPYDCLFACDMALHRDALGDHRFARGFDGHWGYEDIELGYRLHTAGLAFAYVPEAYVYHQETATLPAAQRAAGRRRNFDLAGLIPGFAEYRENSRRIAAVPGAAPARAAAPRPLRAGDR